MRIDRRCLQVLVIALVVSTSAIAEELVVRLESFSIPDDRTRPAPGESPVTRTPTPTGVPGVLRLPVVAQADGTLAVSLRQENLDASSANAGVQQTVRLRLLAPADGRVTEDTRGNVVVSMGTTLAFDNLATGESRIFDVSIRGNAEAGTSYGSRLPIYVEAWRRGEDGKPIENPTKENRSFWGALSGSFEP